MGLNLKYRGDAWTTAEVVQAAELLCLTVIRFLLRFVWDEVIRSSGHAIPNKKGGKKGDAN